MGKSAASIRDVVALALVGLGASNASAITLNSTITVGQLLQSQGNNSFTGTFSIASLLAANNLSSAPINGVTLAAFGYSDAQTNQVTNNVSSTLVSSYATSVLLGYSIGGYTSRSCGFAGWSTCYSPYYVPNYGLAQYRVFNSLTTVTNTDSTIDAIRLTAGTASGTGAVSLQAPNSVTGPTTVSYASNGTYGSDTINSSTKTVTEGYYGALHAGATGIAGDLLAWASSGEVEFTVSAYSGLFRLDSVTLSMEVDPTTIVPLPAGGMLMVGGLAALAAVARKRRRDER
jgi:hypothetical protein